MELDPDKLYERTIRRLDRMEQFEARLALIDDREMLERVVGALLIAEDVLIEIAKTTPDVPTSVLSESTLTVLQKITDGTLE